MSTASPIRFNGRLGFTRQPLIQLVVRVSDRIADDLLWDARERFPLVSRVPRNHTSPRGQLQSPPPESEIEAEGAYDAPDRSS
jgi:hypothetical protein